MPRGPNSTTNQSPTPAPPGLSATSRRLTMWRGSSRESYYEHMRTVAWVLLALTGGRAEPGETYAAILRSEWRIGLEH